MRQRFFNAAFAIVCVALLIVSIDNFRCHRENKMFRATVKAQAGHLSESTDTISSNVLVDGRIK